MNSEGDGHGEDPLLTITIPFRGKKTYAIIND